MSFKKGNVQHYDDFSSGKLIGYDRSHLTFQNNAVQFLTEKNGNQFIRLTSRSKQLSNLNKGDKKNTKDRIEIGTPDLGPLKEDAELWWGFRVKLPPGIEEINVQKITFNQFKQIQKNSSGKDCHPGMMWRMNLENPSTWLAVTDENDNKFNKTLFRNELLSNLVFESFWSCGDLAFWGGFNSIFERDACDDFGKVVKAA